MEQTQPRGFFVVWIDGDGFPQVLKDFLIESSRKRLFPIRFVVNRPVRLPEWKLLQVIVVPQGVDVADDYIAAHAEKGDIAFTSDIPLSEKLVKKEVDVITAKGDHLTLINIGDIKSMRDLMTGLRDTGMISHQASPPKNQSDNHKKKVAMVFDKLLSRRKSMGQWPYF